MTPFVSIWTNDDGYSAGPTVDEKGATVGVDFNELSTVLHVATDDGSVGNWSVAVTLDAENAVSLIEKIAERYGLTVAPQVPGEDARRLEKLESFADSNRDLFAEHVAGWFGVPVTAEPGSLAGRLLGLSEDEEDYDDGKTLIAGVLYDNETGEEADPQ